MRNVLSLWLIFFCSVSFAQPKLTLDSVKAKMQPYTGVHNPGVDTKTLTGKVMCGYQGWFAAEGDGSGLGWRHYGNRNFQPGNCTFEIWPDLSEFDEDEKFDTKFKHQDGSIAKLFSPYLSKTVDRHFKWMKEYGIDGVFLQRFGNSLKNAKNLNHRNTVTANVQAAANQHGRTWAMMYDLSGLNPGEIEKVVIEDWKLLVDRMKILEDKSYLHHKGKPVIAVWGVGFKNGRNYALEECEKLIDFLKNDPKYGGNTLMLGIPAFWRTQIRDAEEHQRLHEVISKADILSPWNVGRYGNPEGVQKHAEKTVKDDISWTEKKGIDFLPVIFPGFSWQNLMKTRGEEASLNQIPRLKGEFLWSQAVRFKQAGAKMLYVAMFDEIDEGTVIFKCTNNPPVGKSKFIDYEGLLSDHYLWLTGKITEMLNGKIKATERQPVRNN